MNNIARIRKKLEEKQLDAILLFGEKNQRFATGFPITDGAVLITEKTALLITDSRYVEAAEKAVDDVIEVRCHDNAHPLRERICEALKEGAVASLGMEESLSHKMWEEYRMAADCECLPAQEILTELRASKTEEEIEYMICAQRISEKALEEVLHIIRPGMTEREVMAELVYHMLKNGSEGNSFDPIVVTGKNTSMPHGIPGDTIIQKGDFVTMDFGSLYHGYCSDMTRTVAVGSATEEMKNIYEIVLQAQLAGIAVARAGIPGKEIDAAARKVIKDAGYGEYFGHGFGHSLGLDIHEMPVAGPRGEALMAVNDLCSAEPGIYIPGKYGVRIEDVMILREDGAEVITKAPKKELIIL